MKTPKEIVVIAGSRFSGISQDRIATAIDAIHSIISNLDPYTQIIITGGASGVDQIAHEQALAAGFETYTLNACWSMGKQAGYLRNDLMVRMADAVYTVWDGQSRGTADTIQRASTKGVHKGTLSF